MKKMEIPDGMILIQTNIPTGRHTIPEFRLVAEDESFRHLAGKVIPLDKVIKLIGRNNSRLSGQDFEGDGYFDGEKFVNPSMEELAEMRLIHAFGTKQNSIAISLWHSDPVFVPGGLFVERHTGAPVFMPVYIQPEEYIEDEMHIRIYIRNAKGQFDYDWLDVSIQEYANLVVYSNLRYIPKAEAENYIISINK